ncbi:homeobox-leucine zipper family protein, partial [Striga asiatica]
SDPIEPHRYRLSDPKPSTIRSRSSKIVNDYQIPEQSFKMLQLKDRTKILPSNEQKHNFMLRRHPLAVLLSSPRNSPGASCSHVAGVRNEKEKAGAADRWSRGGDIRRRCAENCQFGVDAGGRMVAELVYVGLRCCVNIVYCDERKEKWKMVKGTGKTAVLMLNKRRLFFFDIEMDLSYGSGEEEIYNSRKGKKQYHRHSTQQIQQLEAFYKECPHPDKNQRQQLSRELGLDQKQIKFWFQNKRTQIKAQNERADNNALRSENERIHFENIAMQEALENVICPACNGSFPGEEERRNNLLRLRMENSRLKEEHERAIGFFANYMGYPSMPLPSTEPLANIMQINQFPGEGVGPTSVEHVPRPAENHITPHWLSGITDVDRSNIIETAVGSINELMELMHVNEPIWLRTPANGRYTMHRESYDKLYPHSNHIKTASARFESSKDSGEVEMPALKLVEILLDVNKWKDMFPTIISKAKIIDVLDMGILGGLLHLMYEKEHVLSPLVAPREFFFVRYCRQLNQTKWLMVDVSYDFLRGFQDGAPTHSWKLPSGCMIEDMSNGKSTMGENFYFLLSSPLPYACLELVIIMEQVTWIEHVQVDDKSLTHRLYRDLVRSCQAYGAKRWITTLQRMCERFAFSRGEIPAPRNELEGVITSYDGRRNVMKLSHRMVKNFCEALSMSDNLDFPHLSDFENSGVRISFRKSDEPGQVDGFVVSAATSIWLPLLKEDLFDFLRDEKNRYQWDVLSSGNPANAVARITTGAIPGNCISIIQPFVPKETKMLMLQESSLDSLGAQLIYAPMDLPTIISVVNGENNTKIPILPSGYIISGDGRPNKANAASSSSNANNSSNGSLLTVAFQILVCRGPLTKELNMESVATVHALISSTIEKIKTGLNISD